jgi:signal transduction histidine kinase
MLHNLNVKDNKIEINRLLTKGYKYYDTQEYDSSYYFFYNAKYEAELKKDTSRIIHSLCWMAQIQQNQGDYIGSEITSTEAISLLGNSDKYPFGTTNIYIGLGTNYQYSFDTNNAIYCFNKAINSKTDELIKSGIKNNIAVAYIENGNYQQAFEILHPLTLKKAVIKDPITFSKIIDNLGYCYFKLENPKALFYLNKSLKIRIEIKDQWGIFSSYHNLSEYYEERNSIKSNYYAKLAYSNAIKINSVDYRLKFLRLLIQNNSGDELKKYSLAFIHINDSITKVRQKAKNQFAKIKYDSTKEKEENLKLKAQKILQLELQRKKNLLMYLIVGVILVIGIVITYLLLAKNKREKTKATYATEIRISKKLHDELANDVYQTMAFAETQDLSTSRNKEILISSLDTIYSRTRNISQENNAVETGLLFLSDLKEMMTGFTTQDVNVITNGLDSINWTALESIMKIILYRIIQELLVNMKKHSQCSLAVLTFNQNGKKIEIDYTDNGVGATVKQLKSNNGLQNVENRILAVKGIINFDTKSNKGFKVQFSIPI